MDSEEPRATVVADENEIAARPVIAWALDHHQEAFAPGTRLALTRSEGLAAQTFRVTPGEVPTVEASDDLGFAYGIQALAEHVRSGGSLQVGEPIEEAPAVPVRGLVRSFSSIHEDYDWFVSREFWGAYLDFLADCRFNRFHLALGMQYNYGADRHGATDNYLCFGYPFLLEVDGYDVRAEGVDDEERRRNLDALRFIAAETKRRGMSFQLGLWNHAYDYGRDSQHWYPIVGIDESNHAAYSAAALATLLREVPDIDGLTFRVHYEGGIHEAGHGAFWDAVFTGAASAGRPLEIDMHSKGVDDELLRAVRKPGITPVLSAKYWAEHMGLPYHQAGIRAREAAKPIPPGHDMTGITEYARRFTRYGYGDFLSEDRDVDLMFRIWPGTQKLLLWGDPALAAGYGRYSTFGGTRGVDYCEPLFFKGRKGSGVPGGRDPYVRADLALGGAEWKKHRYTYLLMGRLQYNPDAGPETWRPLLRSLHGDAAEGIERALAAASRILPLVMVVHGVNGSNNGYWPEVYLDLPISAGLGSDHYAGDTNEPANWGAASPFDPELFYGIDEFVADAVGGTIGARYTPLEVADRLEAFVQAAESESGGLSEAAGNADTERALIDIAILCRLGRFFAGKFRAAARYALWRQTSDRDALTSAIALAEAARDDYAEILGIVDGVYQSDLAFGVEASEHGHWSDRLPRIDADIAELRSELVAAGRTRGSDSVGSQLERPSRAAGWLLEHEVPKRFVRGEAVEIVARSVGTTTPRHLGLHYRHVNQAERFSLAEMEEREPGMFTAVIPADYTASPYPLMYYLTVETAHAEDLYPGLADDVANQPYFTIDSTQSKRRES